MEAAKRKEAEFVFLSVTAKQFEILLLAYTRCLARKQRDFVSCEKLDAAAATAMEESDHEQRRLTEIMLTMADGGASKINNGWCMQWRS